MRLLLVLLALWVTPAVAECGKASWYGNEHHGRLTASGERFDQNAMTAAVLSRSQFGTYRVTANGKSVTVKANDTGNFSKYGRIIDLSKGAFSAIADPDLGVVSVCIERIR